MTIDEAIELLADIGPQRGTLNEKDIKAIRLGQAALNRHKEKRSWLSQSDWVLLDGETLP
jgi:hypothetical protein